MITYNRGLVSPIHLLTQPSSRKWRCSFFGANSSSFSSDFNMYLHFPFIFLCLFSIRMSKCQRKAKKIV